MKSAEPMFAHAWEPYETERLRCHRCGMVSVDPPKFDEPDYISCPGHARKQGELGLRPSGEPNE